ncbi:MAG: type II secretion system GspH family protein, partial [Pedosphaera sp.]|nr:type II secretion system GspH family protein [Pedosphaera sp.]
MKKKQSAFTLVETIVSIAILSIVLTMVYGVFFSVARSTVAGAEASVEVQRQRIALKTIEDSLSGLVYYEQSKEQYSFLADTTIFEYPSISFVSRVPPGFLGNKEFGSQRLRRITFQVEDDEYLGRSLVMYQEALMQPINTQDIQEPKRWVLGPNLDTFFFVFWSTINNEWVSEWTETNSVPSRLKFELAFKRADGEAARIEEIQKREIIVFSESITQAMQNPPLPQARGGGSRGGKGDSRTSSRKRPTAEQIAAWRKKQAEQSGRDGKDGRSRYTDAQKAEWAKRMRERASSRSRNNGTGGSGGSGSRSGNGSGNVSGN